MSKSEDDFRASVNNMRDGLILYVGGRKDAYRLIATELRKLLCDRNPLLPRLYPSQKLHKLKWTEILERMPALLERVELLLPGQLTMTADGKATFELIFAGPNSVLSVEEWLKQQLFSPHTTIRELIKSVADKEAAHSDPDYNDTLLRAKSIKYVDEESHAAAIVAIGTYVSRLLHERGVAPDG